MHPTVPYKKTDAERFAKLRADYLAKHRAKQDYLISLDIKYGGERAARSFAGRGEKVKLEKLDAAEDKARVKIFELVDRINPQRDFGRGFPAHWIAEKLTWEDAITLGPMSVVPPPAYGTSEHEMLVRAGAITQKERNMAGGSRFGELPPSRPAKGSLFSEIKAAGIPYDHHESDLYVLDTPEAREILASHPRWSTGKKFFTSQTDGKRWIDVPFAYEPWWEARKSPRNFVLSTGRRAKNRVAAHRATRTRAHAGATVHRADGKTVNENGLTFSQWLDAAGGSKHVRKVTLFPFKAWRAGEDPSDYRAARRSA